MDQIDRLVFQVTGQDRGGSKVLSDASAKADAAHQSMSKLGSTLSGLGGPFSQVTDLAGNLGSALDGTVGRAQKLGLGLTAVGVGLTAFAAKDQQAQRQLQQSIENTGSSYADYRGQIDAAIKAQEHNAHTADDTQNALNTLTTATQDAGRALSEMNLVADIAASKHESLAMAATQLVQAQAGNTRAFKSFGIVLDTTIPKSQAIDKALKQLTDRLHGQAPASVDTFTGRLKVLGVQIEDELARLGKYGPALTVVGAALTAVASITQILAARRIADTAAAVRETAANVALASSYETVAASAGAAAVAQGAGGAGAVIGAGMASRIPSAFGIASRVAVPLALAYGTYQTYRSQTATNPQGMHSDEAATLKRLESQGPDAAKAFYGNLQHLGTADSRVGRALKDYIDSTNGAKSATDAASKSATQYATSLTHEADAVATLNVGIDAQIKRLRGTFDKAVGLQQAEDDLQASMHNMAQTVHDGTNALHGHSLAAEANRKALRDSATKILDVIQAMRDQHVGQDKVRASAIKMAGALETQATKTYGSKAAVDKLLGSLGLLPGQIRGSLVSIRGLGADLDNFFAGVAASAFSWGANASAAFQQGVSSNGTATFDPNPNHNPGNTDPGNASAKTYGKKVADQFVSSYAGAVDTGVAASTKKALDKAKAAADAAAAKAKAQAQADAQYMHSVLSTVTSAYQSTKQGLIDAASLANRPQGTDLLGSSGPPQSILASKRQFAHDMIRFAHLLRRLADAHYHQTVIDEVESLGAVDGIAAAVELLAGGGKERRAVNRAEDRIQRASARIAAQTTAGDYGPEIVKALQKLPSEFDRKFEHTLRRLHIITDTGYQDRKQGNRVRAS